MDSSTPNFRREVHWPFGHRSYLFLPQGREVAVRRIGPHDRSIIDGRTVIQVCLQSCLSATAGFELKRMVVYPNAWMMFDAIWATVS